MYTDEQIAKMTPKVHPGIKLTNNWIKVLSDEEYNAEWDKLQKWALKEREYIVENYGKEAGSLFLKIIAPQEIQPFIKAGFSFNYDYMSKLIRSCEGSKNISFLEQELAIKLTPVRESMTTIAVAVNTLWGLKNEFGNNVKTIKEHTSQVIDLANSSLTLLSQGEMGELQYLSKIEQTIKEEAKSDKVSTAIFIKALKSIKKQVNTTVYNEKHKGFINVPEENR